MIVSRDTSAIVQGGRFFPDATPGRIDGSGFGGSFLKVGWIGIGLRMEIFADGQRIITSPVRDISVERCTSPRSTSPPERRVALQSAHSNPCPRSRHPSRAVRGRRRHRRRRHGRGLSRPLYEAVVEVMTRDEIAAMFARRDEAFEEMDAAALAADYAERCAD